MLPIGPMRVVGSTVGRAVLVLTLWSAGAASAAWVWSGRHQQVPAFAPVVRVGPGIDHSSQRQRAELNIVTVRHRGDRRQTGRSPHPGPSAPRLRFRFLTRGPITGQVVIGEAGHIHFGSHDGNLYTLDRDGRLLWSRSLAGPVHGSPLWARGSRVVVGSDAGELQAFAADGAPGFGVGLAAPIDTAPVETSEGLLVVAAGAELLALDARGQQRWRFVAGARIHTSPAIDDADTLYVGAQDHRLYALGRDGRPLWHWDAGADVDASPLVADDGSVVFGSDAGRLHVLDDRGELRWERDFEAPIRAPAALGIDDTLIVVCHGSRPVVEALALSDGATRWRYPLPRNDSPLTDARSGPLVDREGNVYVGAADGRLYALDASGALRFSYATGGAIDSSPALAADGTLYFGSSDGWLYALR